VPDENIREGIQRIASLIDTDGGLLGTDTFPSRNAAEEPTDTVGERMGLADIVALPSRDQPGPTRRRQNR
jgi:hypothetical protein